jgi:type II secretory pathway pseudopilin PulG
MKRLHLFCSMRDKKGFTLIDLLIVVASIAILAAIAIPQFAAYRRRGYNSAAMSDLRNMRTTQEAMFADFQDYGSGSNAVAGASFTMTGAHTSTVPQTVAPSNGVLGIALATASSGKNTAYIIKTTHVAGDQAYGADSDAAGTYRHQCLVLGACTAAADRDIAPITPVSGANEFSGVSTWVQM